MDRKKMRFYVLFALGAIIVLGVIYYVCVGKDDVAARSGILVNQKKQVERKFI